MVALSTMESEYMVLTDITKELKWAKTLIAKLGYLNSKSINHTDLFSNNQNVIALAISSVSHLQVKHIDICNHFVHIAIQDHIIWVQYIPMEEMTADSLMKALGYEKHQKCTSHMGMF